MNCLCRDFRPLASFALLATLAFSPACGDDFPSEQGTDVAALNDILDDVPDAIGDVTTPKDGGDDLDTSAPDIIVPDTNEGDTGGTDAGDTTGSDGGDTAGPDGGDAVDNDGDSQCPGAAGCDCKIDTDCTAGACALESDGHKVCVAPCKVDADCASDRVCQDVAGTKVCVEAGAALCAPCASNADCTYGAPDGACVAGGANGNYCGTGCSADADCDTGYSCDDVKDVAGKALKQCVPEKKAECSCSGYATAVAAKTTCFTSGLPGCTSTRQCLAKGAVGAPADGGLTGCAPTTPTAESCDGLDNNCDGKTDEDMSKGCDDSNACTTDSCAGSKGCAYKKLDKITCDDGNACTKGDACAVGLCAGVTATCDDSNTCTDDACDLATGCTFTNNSKSCDDGDACTKDDGCAISLCSGVTLDCDDNNPCTTDSCSVKSGCANKKLDSGSCDDGSACTTGDTCAAGLCSGVTLDCDDKNVCTDDACDLVSGCTKTNNTKVCDDNSACTVKDACAGGACAGSVLNCNDKNACTDDSCNPKTGCANVQTTKPCTDGDACTNKDVCAGGTCAGTATKCDDGKACTADSCDKASGSCVFKGIVGKACTDGNACTEKDACDSAGACAGKKINCEDGKQCTDDPCDPAKGCAPKVLTTKPCTDGSVCTTSDRCDGNGKCVGTNKSCDDSEACTVDSCDPKKGCQYTNTTKPCDDGDACTQSDVCKGGSCTAGNNTCICTKTSDCAGKSTDLCVGEFVCTAGKCVADLAKKVICSDDKNPCTIDACTPATGKCAYAAVKDGVTCDADGTKCTSGDACQTGKCAAGAKLDCDDSSPCTLDTCDAKTGCANTVIQSGGVLLLDFNVFPGPDGKLGTADDVTPKKDDRIDGQYQSAGVLFGLVNGGAPRIHVSNSLVKPYAPNVLRPVDPQDAVEFRNYRDIWVKLAKPAMRAKVTVLDIQEKQASALRAYNAQGVMIAEAKHPGGGGGLIVALEVKVDGSKGWIARIVVDLTQANDASAGPALYDNFEFEWVPGCTDGNPCTGPDACDRTKGKCLSGKALTCDDGNACTKDSCDALIGCKNEPLDKVPCSDGDKCTEGDTCNKGNCSTGKPLVCDDGKPCTVDRCEPDKGCIAAPKQDGDSCADGNLCTIKDTCKTGKCIAGAALNCNDGDLCTVDACTPATGCTTKPIANCGAKPLQLPYVEPFACSSASGKLWTLKSAQKSTMWAIDATPAKPAPWSGKCALNFNNGTDYTCPTGRKAVKGTATSPQIDLTKTKLPVLTFYLGGTWLKGKTNNVDLQISTDGKNYKTVVTFDPAGGDKWAKKTIALSAYNGKVITLRFSFSTADCKNNTAAGPFIDDIQVTETACFNSADCSDGNVCTVDVCSLKSGKCASSNTVNGSTCTDGNQCTTNSCKKGSCTVAKTVTCLDDKNACTQNAICNPKTGKCAATYIETCNDGDPCTKDSCDAKTGGCSTTQIKPCLVPKCSADSDCFDNNICTKDICSKAGTCQHPEQQRGMACGQGKVCGASKTCDVITGGWARSLSGSAFGYHFCATTATAGVACWGRNNYFQAGNSSSTKSQTTVRVVPGLTGVLSVEAGRYHTCVVTKTGDVWCWGRNQYGQAAPTIKAIVVGTPAKVPGLTNVKSLALGYDYTCALHGDRTVTCWGYNANGQLGNGTTKASRSMTKVADLTGVLAISADYQHTCALRGDGAIYCTGWNESNQVSEKSGKFERFTKRTFPASFKLVGIMTGYRTTCIDLGSKGWGCVGNSKNGAMGTGNTKTVVNGVGVDLNGPEVAQMAGGYYAHYALTRDGDVYAAGRDAEGNFALGKTATSRLDFVKTGYVRSVDVEGVYRASCVLTSAGQIVCAGDNKYGQLGTGNTTDSTSPVAAAGPCVTAKTCVDGNICTTDSCVKGRCVYVASTGQSCTDGDACTISDSCTKGVCAGKPMVCDDKNACTSAEQCSVDGGGKAVCSTGIAKVCDDKNKCTSDSCNKTTGACVYKQIFGCINGCKTAQDCDDGNPCTQNSCLAGVCLKKNGADGQMCDEAKLCTSGVCALGTAGWAAKLDTDPDGTHICALGTDKKVYCWGDGGSFRTGQKTTAKLTKPKAVAGITGATDIVVGSTHSCAKVQGEWMCWGSNSNGQLGSGSTSTSTATPVKVAVVKAPIMLTAGSGYTCALRQDRTVWCWGRQTDGRLGSGSTSSTNKPAGVQVLGLKDVQSIWSSTRHSCAVTPTGTFCWGSNANRRTSDELKPVHFSPVKKAGVGVGVAGGKSTTCWPDKGGLGWCTGDNDNGQLGNGKLIDSGKPVAVVGPKNVGQVAGGGNHTTALTITGKLWVAGDNDNGQLGIGSKTDSKKFVAVTMPGGLAVTQVKSGANFTCALLINGTVSCAGNGTNGVQGDGSTSDDTTFGPVSGPCSAAKDCDDGNSCTQNSCTAGACAIKMLTGPCSDGDPCTTSDVCTSGSCVGKQKSCTDADACTVGDTCKPASGGGTQCAAGTAKVCDDGDACTVDSCNKISGKCVFVAIKGCTKKCTKTSDCDDGNLCTEDTCSGGQCFSAPGIDGIVCAASRVCGAGKCVATGKGWATKVSGSDAGSHFCALGTKGDVFCWGSNSSGQLGQKISLKSSNKPRAVTGISNAIDIVVGALHSCALTKDGKAWCWGRNRDGQLGTGSASVTEQKPVQVTVATGIVQLSAGYGFTCARLATGKVRCWGRQRDGRLGDGKASLFGFSPKGAEVAGVVDAVALWSGARHSCAVTKAGKMLCWGRNASRQLKDASTTAYTKAITKVGAVKGAMISGYNGGICWSTGLGKASCTGANGAGELGFKAGPDSGVPVAVVGPKWLIQGEGGDKHVAMVNGDGSLWLTGANKQGQLGTGNTTASAKYVQVMLPGGAKAVYVDATVETTCAVGDNGQVYCSGRGSNGENGDGSFNQNKTFALAAGPCLAAADCSDGNPCTADACVSNACLFKLRTGTKCDDGQLCTDSDACVNGTCLGKPRVCDDKNACTANDRCEVTGGAAVCTADPAKRCDDGDTCTADSCDVATGKCKFAPIKGCVVKCTVDKDCDDKNSCTSDICDKLAGICSNKAINEGKLCSDVGGSGSCKAGVCAALTAGWASAIASDSDGGHFCALRHDKTVACWGENADGQIGDGNKKTVRKPVVVKGLSNVKQLALGSTHSCGLRNDGKLYCWGANSSGQGGTGKTNGPDSLKPTLASSIPLLQAVWAGYKTTCGLTMKSELMCWGYGQFGERGDGTSGVTGIPQAVKGLPKATILQMEIQGRRRCVVMASGDLYCWGYNGSLDVANSKQTAIRTATKRSNVSGIALLGGGSGTVCAVIPAAKAMKCWGDGSDGELGSGKLITRTTTPLTAEGITTRPVQITGGGDHTLVLTDLGQIYTTGRNASYQLGDGTKTQRMTFSIASKFAKTYVAVAATANTTCALGTDGEVYCVGANAKGSAGVNSKSSVVKSVTKVIAP